MIKLAIETNDKGVYFPVWGTCLGFELLHSVLLDLSPDFLKDINGE